MLKTVPNDKSNESSEWRYAWGRGHDTWAGRGAAGMIDLAQHVQFCDMIQGSVVKSLHGRKL